jgi:hypothetical protein
MTNEEFEVLWELNPMGIKENTYWVVKQFLQGEPTDSEGKVINFDRFCELYKNYVEFLEPYQNEKYTKTGYDIKNLQEFINGFLYLKSFKKPKKLRDQYLFGDFHEDYLKSRLEKFKAKFIKSV